jgi:geranylgeranyl pyrophosphate synthase
MHELKTGALLQASVMMGAVCGHASAQATAALQSYGSAIGLAFQVVDDILDVTADSSTLGKTAGKDADNNKPTYVSLMGLQASQAYAQRLLAGENRTGAQRPGHKPRPCVRWPTWWSTGRIDPLNVCKWPLALVLHAQEATKTIAYAK